MRNTLPVIAAVPNYNMGPQLETLLPQLRRQNYDEIFVLDDASTDGSLEIVEELDLGVKVIGSRENRGAGPTRNLIIGQLGHRSIIHFLDADVDVLTDDIPERARELMPCDRVAGFTGGLVLNPDGTQNMWNYGPRQSLYSYVGALVQKRVGSLMKKDPDRAEALRSRYARLLADRPDPFSEPRRRPVYSVIEQNFLIQSITFEAVGGFDPSYREHGIQDLAIRIDRHRLPRYFDPSIAVRHKAIDVRHYNRQLARLRAEVAINRHHGVGQWLLPEGRLVPKINYPKIREDSQ